MLSVIVLAIFFFYKPRRYSFEREFRMLLTPGENEIISCDDPADFGRHVPVRLKKVIGRVITHRRASDGFKVKVEGLLHTYMKSVSREDSTLLP